MLLSFLLIIKFRELWIYYVVFILEKVKNLSKKQLLTIYLPAGCGVAMF